MIFGMDFKKTSNTVYIRSPRTLRMELNTADLHGFDDLVKRVGGKQCNPQAVQLGIQSSLANYQYQQLLSGKEVSEEDILRVKNSLHTILFQ